MAVCEHLAALETYLNAKHIPINFRGQAWSKNCREWVYYDCVLDFRQIKARFVFNECIAEHSYFDIKAGSESGFFCTCCLDGIMGFHPDNPISNNYPIIASTLAILAN